VGGRWNDRIQQLKSTSTIASATLPQAVVAELLASGDYDRHLRRIRPRYAASTAVMGQAVARSFPPGTCVTRPNGGYVLWVEMPEEVDALKLYESALAAGISIAPGPLFSAKQRYRHFVRLNAAWWSAQLADAVDELGRIAHRLHGLAGRRRRSRA
nr:hypothetical protein [Planctomycetota bacterium]